MAAGRLPRDWAIAGLRAFAVPAPGGWRGCGRGRRRQAIHAQLQPPGLDRDGRRSRLAGGAAA